MGSVYLRGNSYVVKFKDENGRWKRKSVGQKPAMTKTRARIKLHEYERMVKDGEYKSIDAKIPTLKEYAGEYISYQKDVKQIRSHDRTRTCIEHCCRFMGNMKLSEITADDIDRYKQHRLSEGKKQNTIARELQVLRNLFNHAYKRDRFFGKNPVAESGLPTFNDKKERVVTEEEERNLLKASEDYLKDIIQIALNTGMRRGEILGLRWEWIDINENIINLPQTHTKNNKSRMVPLNETARRIILERKLRTGGIDFVFPSEDSKTGHLTWLRRSFNTACKNANIENLRFHDLKHTAITRMVEAGIPRDDISKVVGTSYRLIVERYSHQKESLRKAVDCLVNI